MMSNDQKRYAIIGAIRQARHAVAQVEERLEATRGITDHLTLLTHKWNLEAAIGYAEAELEAMTEDK